MCVKCVSASQKLQAFLLNLEQEFPGTMIADPDDGKPRGVSPGHHVFVAVLAASIHYGEEERLFKELTSMSLKESA